jgi:hypothetical protein
MGVGLISRAVIDRPAFGLLSQEEEIVQQVWEACFGVIFAEPVAFPKRATYFFCPLISERLGILKEMILEHE